MRAQSRIEAFKVIFANLFGTDPQKNKKEIFAECTLTKNDKEFADSLISAFLEHQTELQSNLDNIVENYTQERIYKVDLALIVMAMAEIKFIKTPKPVVVNEVVEIAKKFSTEKSPSFINGVLAKFE